MDKYKGRLYKVFEKANGMLRSGAPASRLTKICVSRPPTVFEKCCNAK